MYDHSGRFSIRLPLQLYGLNIRCVKTWNILISGMKVAEYSVHIWKHTDHIKFCFHVPYMQSYVMLWYHLRDLVPFVQFTIAEACNFTKSNTPPFVFFTFSKLYKWYQIVQSVSYFYYFCFSPLESLKSKQVILFFLQTAFHP